ncbi:pseudouridine synthase [Patescibacteria group bacterium]
MQERLQKILSQAGVCSRRKAEELILSGKVKVNNKIASLGDQADLKKDKIQVAGKEISNNQEFVYYILNKPKGYVSSTQDKHADKLVIDLVPQEPKVWPVGRLDKDSIGLIVLTNDGDLTNKLTHPSFQHEKEYEVIVNKPITDEFLEKMQKGIKLNEGIARADKIKKISNKKFNIILHQGWKRQIRRMCETLKFQIVELKRIRIDKIKLDDLAQGDYKLIFKKQDTISK